MRSSASWLPESPADVHDRPATGLAQFLHGLAPFDQERARRVLLTCATIEVDAGEPRFANVFPPHALVLVDEGFIVLRGTAEPAPRSVITCEAGPGRMLLPPTPDELLGALARSRLIVIDSEARGQLLRVPALAERVVEQLALALAQKRDATANFALTRHIDRVKRKLVQLAGSYGHVVREGIRIDFPVSHALLAEMIGSSRETVTRAVDRLQREGVVDRRGSTYCLLVPPESICAGLQA
jgi:hypothetical protein